MNHRGLVQIRLFRTSQQTHCVRRCGVPLFKLGLSVQWTAKLLIILKYKCWSKAISEFRNKCKLMSRTFREHPHLILQMLWTSSQRVLLSSAGVGARFDYCSACPSHPASVDLHSSSDPLQTSTTIFSWDSDDITRNQRESCGCQVVTVTSVCAFRETPLVASAMCSIFTFFRYFIYTIFVL
ncbi:hypothetical protein ANCCEY_08317 [Ancylostoma ceylanicum]|uniref:Uncharacterized protein n=1 Tax=Ancylostoma ceylanicum TaxID=53326 RepID=A0A0D6LRE5_9BILA|nr:hypothetical protein ANCCEY_08317 [Ancylostoma ceylanicum]